MKNVFELDGAGNIRIIVDGKKSPWTPYDSIAQLRVNGKFYIAASAYYDGHMPCEKVLLLAETETEAKYVTRIEGSEVEEDIQPIVEQDTVGVCKKHQVMFSPDQCDICTARLVNDFTLTYILQPLKGLDELKKVEVA